MSITPEFPQPPSSFSRSDWQDQVGQGNTDLGYREWVRACVENMVKAQAEEALSPDPGPALVDIAGLSRMLSISKRCASRLVAMRELPQPIRLGRRCRWPIKAIHAWIEAAAERANQSLPYPAGRPRSQGRRTRARERV